MAISLQFSASNGPYPHSRVNDARIVLGWTNASLYIENVVTLEFEHHRARSAASPTFDERRIPHLQHVRLRVIQNS